MEKCPCGSDLTYKECCEPIIIGDRPAETAKDLMKSRYTAFAKGNIEYILNTVHPEKREADYEKSIRKWSENSQWLGFEIIDVKNGGPEDSDGEVEFIAKFRQKTDKEYHHEIALFKKLEDKWYFYDAKAPVQKQFIRQSPKVGRNDPCPCGSGKKFKKCCGK